MIATPVSKEEVRLLAIQIGVREAARRLGLNEDRVCQWSKRGQWFASPNHILAKATPVSTVSRAGDVLVDELSENGKETKLKLSRYAKRQAEHLEMNGKLSDHRAFKDIAQGAAGLHGWNDQKQGESFSLNVLNMGALEVRVGKEEQDSDPTISE